eukprot:3856536-Rhodomonas_salina.1
MSGTSPVTLYKIDVATTPTFATLGQHMILLSYAMPGTDTPHGTTAEREETYFGEFPPPANSSHEMSVTVSYAISLRACYAMSGTEIAYYACAMG